MCAKELGHQDACGQQRDELRVVHVGVVRLFLGARTRWYLKRVSGALEACVLLGFALSAVRQTAAVHLI